MIQKNASINRQIKKQNSIQIFVKKNNQKFIQNIIIIICQRYKQNVIQM